ncbi:hypothetical protein DT076_09210 [Desertihabitans brevis]|uniref:Uncharacterized protein n=1 Tax=Desertihabitans brevis TaxID=2268447 RepID=A0A367YVR3_9ACTN|nr:hypothetical protein [Desertihabitans brevis]RCK69629.1 hypothetical protein DT076_09210 [Desertihabitans brevis]
MNETPNARYGSLGPGIADRDAERLAHELFIARQQVFPERPQDVVPAVVRTLRRIRMALLRLRPSRPRAL